MTERLIQIGSVPFGRPTSFTTQTSSGGPSCRALTVAFPAGIISSSVTIRDALVRRERHQRKCTQQITRAFEGKPLLSTNRFTLTSDLSVARTLLFFGSLRHPAEHSRTAKKRWSLTIFRRYGPPIGTCC